MNDINNKVNQFEKQIVSYGAYTSAYRKIQFSIHSTLMRGTPSCAVLVGESGSGKTTLCQQLLSILPEPSVVETPRGAEVRRPALMCTLPNKATVKTFAKSLLKALSCEVHSGDAYDLTERAITQISLQHVQVAYLDEIQMLADKKADQARKDVSNCIARLADVTGVAIVAAGTPVVEELFYSVDLLVKRFPFFAKLPPLSLNLTNENSDYQVVLRSLDKKMYEIGDLRKGVHLNEPPMALSLYAASAGNMGTLRTFLAHAFFFALTRGDRTLQREDFYDAFEMIHPVRCLTESTNPLSLAHARLLKEVTRHVNSK